MTMNETTRAALRAELESRSEADLRAALVGYMAEAETGIEKACHVLVILAARGLAIPATLPGVLGYYREIAEGKLSAHAAWLLGGKREVLDAVMKCPLPLQDEIADGKPIPVATRYQGRISSTSLTIYEMTQGQIRLAFSEERGLAPLEDQQKWLFQVGEKSAGPVPEAPKVKIAVDREQGRILVNRTPVTVDEFREAFAALGWQIKPIYGASGFAAKKSGAA